MMKPSCWRLPQAVRCSIATDAATGAPERVVIVIEETRSYRHPVPVLHLFDPARRTIMTSFTDSHGVDYPSQPYDFLRCSRQHPRDRVPAEP